MVARAPRTGRHGSWIASKQKKKKNVAFADGVASFLRAASSLLPAVSSLLRAHLVTPTSPKERVKVWEVMQ